MTKQTLISTIVLWIWVVAFSVGVVSTNKANANEEIINLQKRNFELEQLIQDAKDAWHIAEESKAECIESWNLEQQKEQKKADAYRAELQENQDRLGLMLQRQLQK